MGDDAWVYAYVRGYWITRYLDDTCPALLSRLLAGRMRNQEIERQVAQVLGVPRRSLWQEIDRIVASHFRDSPAAT